MKYVIYPCSGFDGSAVKVFSKKTNNFIYIDQEYSKKTINDELLKKGFRGYDIVNSRTPSWGVDIKKEFKNTCFFKLKRTSNYSDDWGPEYINILFVCSEAVIAMNFIFEKLGSPLGTVYVRPGISFGGNYNTYPNQFQNFMLKSNPKYLLFDETLSPDNGAYLPMLRKRYAVQDLVICDTQMLKRNKLYLSRLRSSFQKKEDDLVA